MSARQQERLDRLKRKRRIIAMPDDELALRRFASDNDSQRELENQEWAAIVRTMAEGLSERREPRMLHAIY